MDKKELLDITHFSDYLKPAQVIHDLKAKDKVQAIEELLDVLAKQKLIVNKKVLLTRLIDRENLVSTALGDGIAVPHARVDTGGEMAIAAGRSASGIDFEALDKKKVHLIILIIWNPGLPGLFNHLFAGLASFLRKPEFRERIFKAADKNDLCQALAEIELHLPQEDKIVSRAGLLKKLQEIEMKKRKAPKAQAKTLASHAALIREELDEALLTRFDKLIERYGFAVTEVDDGVCQGCYISVSTEMSSAIEGSNDIYVCENCGKYLVAAKKKKK
ncbi:MAG: PTS sugar transporter subunit IIA [Acidobacteriota bacterium]|nr:PTS sugar transporter subunit IIA [Acidobacteriota bacterium]